MNRSRLMHKLITLALPLALVVLMGCAARAEAPASTPAQSKATALPVVKESATGAAIAKGRLVPRQWVALAPSVGGEVTALPAAEGTQVEQGQLLLQLNDARQKAALAEAQGALQAAQARLAEAKNGATAEQIAVAQAAVAVARGQAKSAEGTVAAAEAALARLRAGATAEELAIAQRYVASAKNALWAAQGQRDAICGAPGPSGSCESARGAVAQAEEAVNIAELQLKQTQAGPTQADLDAAQGQVTQAQGQLEGARSGVAQAEATLAHLKKGSTPETIAAAEGAVAQAQAAVQQAQAALADTQMRAPLSGQMARLDAKIGEKIQPGVPVIQLADLSAWQAETDDLTEIQVVRVRVGQPVTVVADALPELKLKGTVESVGDVFEKKQGDVTYTVKVKLEQPDPRLRWGMTVKVSFE